MPQREPAARAVDDECCRRPGDAGPTTLRNGTLLDSRVAGHTRTGAGGAMGIHTTRRRIAKNVAPESEYSSPARQQAGSFDRVAPNTSIELGLPSGTRRSHEKPDVAFDHERGGPHHGDTYRREQSDTATQATKTIVPPRKPVITQRVRRFHLDMLSPADMTSTNRGSRSKRECSSSARTFNSCSESGMPACCSRLTPSPLPVPIRRRRSYPPPYLPARAGLRVKSQLFRRPSRTSWGGATSRTAASRAVLERPVQDAALETSPVVNDDTDDHVHDERTFGTVVVDSFLLR